MSYNLMNLITIILFFIYIYGLGHAFTRRLKTEEKGAIPGCKCFILQMAVGLAAIPVIGFFLNALNLPIDWRIFLTLSLISPVASALDSIRKGAVPYKCPTDTACSGEHHKKRRAHFLVIFFFLATTVLYCTGPFQYPWLEDDDSWEHAAAAQYIAVEKNVNAPSGLFQYINPYPPGYDILMGVLRQTTPSIYWTLKFFNSLIISLGVLFFFLLAHEFTGDRKKSLMAVFLFCCIPCYMSHFIWAHSLAVTLFFPAFYFLLKVKDDRRFIPSAVIVIAAILLIHPFQSIKLLVMALLLYLSVCLVRKKLSKEPFIVLFLAVCLSMLWWGPVFYKIKTGGLHIATRTETVDLGSVEKSKGFLSGIFSPDGGSATRVYYPDDYLFPREANLINNPTGIGLIFCCLAGLGLFCFRDFFRKEVPDERKIYLLTILLWLIFTFLGLNSKTFHLPVGLYAFRFWMLFAVPVCFFAAEGFFVLSGVLQRDLIRNSVCVLIVSSIVATSWYPRAEINSGAWPFGVEWGSNKEILGYTWMREHFKPGTRVFAFFKNKFVIGHDMRADYWRDDYQRDFSGAFDLDVMELHRRLKQHQFEYLMVGRKEILHFGEASVNAKVRQLNESGLFRQKQAIKGHFALFEVL